MVEALDSPRYRGVLDYCSAFLAIDAGRPPGHPPVRIVASKRIRRTNTHVTERGRAIAQDPDAPAARLQDLRIRRKKLRYLLEHTRTLYPKEPLRQQIKALGRLQDNLGDFNDFEVHRENLSRRAALITEAQPSDAGTRLAAGDVYSEKEERQQDARRADAKRFNRPARLANRRRFQALFAEARIGCTARPQESSSGSPKRARCRLRYPS